MTLMKVRIGLVALASVALAGCAVAAPLASTTPVSAEKPGTAHGAIDGVMEAAEPQLQLVAIDDAGNASMLDLISGTESRLNSLEAPGQATTDGRYVFAAHDSGVEIIDSGAWTWDHTDHFHYYLSTPRSVGTVSGAGTATVTTTLLSTAGSTGLFFPFSGEAILLDNAALSEGKISVTRRIASSPHKGVVAALGDGVLLSQAEDGDESVHLAALDAAGNESGKVACAGASGTITTRAGVVVGCAGGAVIAAVEDGQPVLRSIAYPVDAAPPATSFGARKGRPTIAGIGSGNGIWLLETREGNWTWLPTTTQPLAAATVDDAAGHVVAVLRDGTVRVYAAGTGEELAATDALLASTLADPGAAEQVSLVVDGQRAYVNAPTEGVVYEIDYADGARVSRTLTTAMAPRHVLVTGR